MFHKPAPPRGLQDWNLPNHHHDEATFRLRHKLGKVPDLFEMVIAALVGRRLEEWLSFDPERHALILRFRPFWGRPIAWRC
jgi:hypothetical protein